MEHPKQVRDLLPAKDQQLATQPTAQKLPTFEKWQYELTAWFFLRLFTCYGTKYTAQFPTEKDLKLIKREWCLRICRYTRTELHRAIEYAKDQREKGDENYSWPDIGLILGYLRRAPESTYTPIQLPDKQQQEKNDKAAQVGLEKLKNIMKE